MKVTEVDLDALNAMDAPTLLRFAFENFGRRAAIGTSMQKSGCVNIDLASRLGVDVRVFYIDTLLDYDETYELIDRAEEHYGITIERFEPDPEELAALREWLGQWEHYYNRHACCNVRKTRSLHRAQKTLDVWISGLREDQSKHRAENARKAECVFTSDGRHILKLNPLLDWSAEQVDAYIAEHDVPINALYNYISPFGEQYFVISCQRCHIPVKPTLGPRAGKWPWECGGVKECGLHIDGSGI
jgi:phosphoadenosine phosphosulfate reductase